MGGRQPAHRFAIALGAVSAALPVLGHLVPLVSRSWEWASPSVAANVAGFGAWIPSLLVPIAAVWLALRADWRARAGLVLLAVHGLLAVPGLHVVGYLGIFGDDPLFVVAALRPPAAVAAGIAALLALRGPLPPWPDGPTAELGVWRWVAVTAAGVLAVAPAADFTVTVSSGFFGQGFSGPLRDVASVAGSAAQVVVWLAAAALLGRAADGRRAALLAVVPGAVGLVEAVGAVSDLVLSPRMAGVLGPPAPSVWMRAIAGTALAAAALAIWVRARPLRPTPEPAELN